MQYFRIFILDRRLLNTQIFANLSLKNYFNQLPHPRLYTQLLLTHNVSQHRLFTNQGIYNPKLMVMSMLYC